MSAACLLVGTVTLALASQDFDLSWQHSVEKTGWREHWIVDGGQLRLTEAAVKGSGAGMDPGAGAKLRDGWWVWTPELPPVQALSLAASGATGGGWHLCDAASCHEFGFLPGEAVDIRPCR